VLKNIEEFTGVLAAGRPGRGAARWGRRSPWALVAWRTTAHESSVPQLAHNLYTDNWLSSSTNFKIWAFVVYFWPFVPKYDLAVQCLLLL
jgi:hypothetical protein